MTTSETQETSRARDSAKSLSGAALLHTFSVRQYPLQWYNFYDFWAGVGAGEEGAGS